MDIDVLVVVLVQGGYGPRVANPEVDGVGSCLQCDAREGNVALDMAEKGEVLMAQVVVFFNTEIRYE